MIIAVSIFLLGWALVLGAAFLTQGVAHTVDFATGKAGSRKASLLATVVCFLLAAVTAGVAFAIS